MGADVLPGILLGKLVFSPDIKRLKTLNEVLKLNRIIVMNNMIEKVHDFINNN